MKRIIILLVVVIMMFVLWPRSIVKSVVVNQDEFQIELYENEDLVNTYPITAGKLTSLTSVGTFKAISREVNVDGLYGLKFPYWVGVYITRGFENGIHSVEGENKWSECIGNSNCTPGSIILNGSDMKELYEWIEIGTKIIIEKENI